jgi:hypothetical protein
VSWHFLQAGEAASWEDSCLDGAPSALSSLIPTHEAFCSQGNETESCNHSRYGTTCALSMGGHGEDTSTSSAAASHARTSVAPGKAQDSPASDRGFGRNSPASFARYDPATHSLKTVQCSLFEDLTESSPILPRWGSMRNGGLFLRPTWEPRTCESEYGLLPTPTATDARGRTYYYSNGTKDSAVVSLVGMAKLLPTPAATDWKGRYTWETVRRRMDMTRGVRLPEELCREAGKAITPNPEFWEWMMGWPIGATDLKPLAMAKFREWLQQHGGF